MTLKGSYINDIFLLKKIKISNLNKTEYIKINDLISLMKIIKDDTSSLIKYESLSENNHKISLHNTGEHKKIFGEYNCVYEIDGICSLEFDLIQDLINK